MSINHSRLTLSTHYQTQSTMQKHIFTSLYCDSRTDFDNRRLREETYIFYPPSEVPRRILADAGFYITGNEDISQCFACKLQINRLKRGVDPMSVHRLRSPTCPFVIQSPLRESTNEGNLTLERPTFVDKLAPKTTVGEFASLLSMYFDIGLTLHLKASFIVMLVILQTRRRWNVKMPCCGHPSRADDVKMTKSRRCFCHVDILWLVKNAVRKWTTVFNVRRKYSAPFAHISVELFVKAM
jgi:hypothetical protein